LDAKPDKVGAFDSTVILNSKGGEFLGPLIHHRVKELKSLGHKLFPFDAAQYKIFFVEAGEMLNLDALHPDQTRHGGAAEDLNGKERDHANVKQRGRWMTDQRVRRYTKTGKIQQMISRLSAGHLDFCRWSLLNMELVMKGLTSPKMP
jgi:hypothetical protein